MTRCGARLLVAACWAATLTLAAATAQEQPAPPTPPADGEKLLLEERVEAGDVYDYSLTALVAADLSGDVQGKTLPIVNLTQNYRKEEQEAIRANASKTGTHRVGKRVWSRHLVSGTGALTHHVPSPDDPRSLR